MKSRSELRTLLRTDPVDVSVQKSPELLSVDQAFIACSFIRFKLIFNYDLCDDRKHANTTAIFALKVPFFGRHCLLPIIESNPPRFTNERKQQLYEDSE